MAIAKKQLTAKQQEVLDFIRGFIRLHGYPPSVTEIDKHFGVYRNSIVGHIVALERKGHLRRVPNIARGLVLL